MKKPPAPGAFGFCRPRREKGDGPASIHRIHSHTVVVIEHNLDVMAEADYLIDIGPEAGSEGGTIVAQGTPEEVAKSKHSRTAPFLAGVLGKFGCGDAGSAQFSEQSRPE